MPLTAEYIGLSQTELEARIYAAKEILGRDLVILGHHYQRPEVIKFANFRGDSFGLSKIASEQSAKFIVFCGVHFMAEAASVLAKPEQKVFIPDMMAGCPMADMASISDIEVAWSLLSKKCGSSKIIPVVYMNSDAEAKAFCGRHGGVVCTSGNAARVFDWVFANGDKMLFMPDEHLGRNTAKLKNIPDSEVAVWNPLERSAYGVAGAGRLSDLDCAGKKVFVWSGFCHVHTFFTVEHVEAARKKYPDAKIIVHPESGEDVVAASDANASTEGILKFVEALPKNSTVVIGTEINFVSRLAAEHPDKTIVPLSRSLCPNMFRVSLQNLCWLLENLVKGNFVNEVCVPEEIKKDALLSLERMLKI